MRVPSFLFRISILKTFTRAIFLTIALFLITQHALAQFNENFDDGEFTANPSWTGATSEFIINTSAQLQVNAPGASSPFLSSALALNSLDNYEWRVYVRQGFSGSTNNYGRVYLVSDQQDVGSSLHGYYLQFGEAGSNDAVELFRQTSTQSVSVCRATNGIISSAFQVRVRVTRDTAGLWKLYVDYTGGSDFVFEASGTDATYNSSNFIGVHCVFTASNATKFYYDDFYAGPIVVDTKPPELVSLKALSSSLVEVIFNEALDAGAAVITDNFNVLPDFRPTTSVLQPNQRSVVLSFNPPLSKSSTFIYTIAISGIIDIAGNIMLPTQRQFVCFDPIPPLFKDVIFNEVFPDPQPEVGLPNAEFVEIYNRGASPFDLSGWTISDDKSAGKIPDMILLPGRFLIVTSTSAASELAVFGDVIGVSGFPSLNNTGDVLVMKDNHEQTVDSIQYAEDWYRDDVKAEGGWSLEIIDPQNICESSQNWVASEDDDGGTPGQANSVLAENPDLTGPLLIGAAPLSSHVVVLKFDDVLSKQLPSPTDFLISPSVSVVSVSFADASLSSLQLNLSDEILPGMIYTLSVKQIFDCAGNLIHPDHASATFGLPEDADSLDVVVNEILFNPRPTGIDFVEVINVSKKFINLKGWTVGNVENDSVVNRKAITASDLLLSPGGIIVFTENGDRVKGEYVQARLERILEVEDLPSFNDDAGSVAIVDGDGNTIDSFAYFAGMHSPYLKNDDGVSLERSNATAVNPVWESASSLTGYATPGYENSATLPDSFQDDMVRVVPEIFEPVTGQPSSADIQFVFDQGNYVANVKILDPEGRTIRQLSNNDLLGAHGNFIWDGRLDDGSVARIGYYIVWFEVFHNNGAIHTYRKKVAIAGRL